MKIWEDEWLSAIVGHHVFKIEPDHADLEAGEAGLREVITDYDSRYSAAMYYAKIDTRQIEMVRCFSKTGFYVVDVNITFGGDKNSLSSNILFNQNLACAIGEIYPEQYGAVLNIAASCFQYSRFHLDPLIPDRVANQIKHDWILNYINQKRGERLWVASIGQVPAGFLAVLGSKKEGKSTRIIDLVGVSRNSQKQGIGGALVAFFINHYKDQCDYLLVGTQVANIPSIKLYQKFGFSLVHSAYIMHRHIRPPLEV